MTLQISMNVWIPMLVRMASYVQILRALTIVPAQLVTSVMEVVAYVSSTHFWIVHTQHYLLVILLVFNICYLFHCSPL